MDLLQRQLIRRKLKVEDPPLIYLKISDDFDQKLNQLSDELEYLELGKNFNQPLNKLSLPKKLKKIKFGDKFNQKIENLPE